MIGEAFVLAVCPTVHHDAAVARCFEVGLNVACKRGWDVVVDVNDWLPFVDDWMPTWEAGVVKTATRAVAKCDGCKRVTLVFIRGGPCCELETSRRPNLMKSISAALPPGITVDSDILEFDDFMEKFRPGLAMGALGRSVATTMKYYKGPMVNWTRDSQQDLYYPKGSTERPQQSDEFHSTNLVGVGVSIRSARHMEEHPATMRSHGFTLARSPTAMRYEDFYQHERVVSVYFPEIEKMLRETIGAAHVLPLAYIVRSHTKNLAGERVQGAERVQIVAPTVHLDHTADSAEALLDKLRQPPKPTDAFHQGKMRTRALSAEEYMVAKRTGKWGIIHVWRNIRDEPVQNIPLAVADWRTVREDDLSKVKHHYYPVGDSPYAENSYVRHDGGQEWHYFEKMVRDEALIFATWSAERYRDTGKASRSSVMHAAFEDPTAPPEAPDREAVDLRCFCIFEPAKGVAASMSTL